MSAAAKQPAESPRFNAVPEAAYGRGDPLAGCAASRVDIRRGTIPRPGLVLFAEDFDAPRPRAVPEPEVIEPTLTSDDLQAARAQAWQAGHAAGIAASAQAETAAIRAAIDAIAAGLTDARTQAAITAQDAADELARLLFDSFAAAFPDMCAAYGEAELTRLIRTLLPALGQEPSIAVRVSPLHAGAIRQEIERADPAIAAHVEIVASETIGPGDIRIAWRNGHAVRDSAALWRRIMEILAPAGLTSYAESRESEHVE